MFTEAMADDDELAESLADYKPGTSGPRVSEYTPTVARLDIIADRLADLTATTVKLQGGKATPPRPARRPETAMARVQRRRSEAKLGSLIAEVQAAQARHTTPTK